MQFMLTIYADSSQYRAPDSDEGAALHGGWMTYTQEMQEAGITQAGAALQPPSTGLTIRGEDCIITDGPFAETKEQLGGFYLIDVPDIETAQAWACRAPHLAFGSVEVRPVAVIEANVS